MNLFISDAYAQGVGGAGGIMGLLPIVLMFVVFYFLLIRPQQKRAKEHKAMVASIQKGDEVVTSGGILGTVAGVKENYVSVTIAEGIKIKMQAEAVAQVLPKGTVKSA
ncbi:MAG: preprotein translocase subunit YajC [Saprospiraceae bacterium]|jgi:preprotein translocase subunit YajC